MLRMEPARPDAMPGQLRRGTLEYCVLALLRRDEHYALDLVRELSAVEGMETSEGTIYPLLSRLRRDGLVETTWHDSPTGPPRRYYRITPAGRERLDRFVGEWIRFRNAVDSFVVVEGTG